MQKALFFDIDGTLVNFKGEVSDSTKRALMKVRANGHKIVLCSGRSACQIDTSIFGVPFDGIIAASGAYVSYNDQVIYEHFLSDTARRKIVDCLESAHAKYTAQTEKLVVTEKNKAFICQHFHITNPETVLEVDNHIEERNDIKKFTFCQSQVPLHEIQKALAPWCQVMAISFENATDDAGEICALGIDKALGIQKYIDFVGIDRKDTLSFGDGPNDYEMIDYAQIGVAMGNAIAGIKERADYITTSVNEDGIEKALKHFKLIE